MISEFTSLISINRDTIPCHVDAKGCVGLFATTLVDVASSFHHLLNRFVVAEFEFMDHLLTILNDSNLSKDAKW